MWILVHTLFYRLLYWSRYHGIGYMGMDGSNIQEIVTSDVDLPYGLIVDPYSDRIWWSDRNNHLIE